MTWEEMQKQAEALTWSEVEALQRDVIKQYSDAINAIDALLTAQYAKLAGAAPEDYYNEVLKYNRLNTLLAEVRTAYTEASKRAGNLTMQASELAMTNEYYRKMYVASWLEDFPEISVGALPQPLIDITVYSQDAAWKAISQKIADKIVDTYGTLDQYYPESGTLSELLYKNMNDELRKIADQITQGLARGISYTKMMEGIRDIIGRQIRQNGSLTLSGAMANALRIIRTEANRTLNAGAHAADMELETLSPGSIEKMWVATLDDRTRPTHAAVDGQKRPPDKTFSNGLMYPSEINCRCTTVTIVDGQAPSLRRGRNPSTGENEVMEFKTFDQWASENGLKKNKHGQIYKKE